MTARQRLRTFLVVAGSLEVLTLGAMLVNLATVSSRPLASVLGPVHGFTWVAIIAVCLLAPQLSGRQRALATIPVFGGILTARTLRSPEQRDPHSPA